MRVDDFRYELPETAIAQTAIEPRHGSRLLDTRDTSDHIFSDLPDLLEPGDLLVVNNTKVRAARLIGRRAGTGGTVELLLLERRDDGVWVALAKPARRLRPGVVVEFEGFTAVVENQLTAGMVEVSLDADDEELAIAAAGEMPLPPYFTGQLADPNRYQTLYAEIPGSAAAPTAGLHFTELVMERLAENNVSMAMVDLHVSLDTFRPMSVEMVEDHQMHSEWCLVPQETADAVNASTRVIAVGTTVVRTLESFADDAGNVTSGSHQTDLFLTPGYRFRVVDGLITNFHMPSSTLLVLLAAFMGPGWRDAYAVALDRGYRFLSFGDAMYVERGQLLP
jgi:S-adenosylmethionine:tRNA ribosyltransferase-isomerase